MRALIVRIIFILVFAMVGIVVRAQDVTSEPDASATGVVTDVVDQQPVDATGGEIVIPVTPMSLTDWIVIVLLVFIAVVQGYFVFVRKGDAAVVDNIGYIRHDRQQMRQLENAYQNLDKPIQLAFDNVADMLDFVAKLTVIKADDAAISLMRDIQHPGAEPQG